ncbi:MAG TPA: RNA polymerase sigma factor SigJ [Ilumatobacteraceae bacterium]|nr:RNA polymerase sigma factor SigJ [Ilumatobacteraceae bacterium]
MTDAAPVSAADTATFDTERPRLRGLAYRMTGTPDDADDVVQDVWLRWQHADRSSIDNPAAWLTTVTTRVALDRLTSAVARREQYVGPWVPEPLADPSDDPAEHVAAADSLTLGFLRVLETLQPVERAVFLLHDVFDMPFREVAVNVGRDEAATRQIAKRARDRVRDGRPRVDPRPDEVRTLCDAFLAAVLEGDVDRLATMLTDDAVYISDGGPNHHAARRPVVGPRRVATLLANVTRRDVRPTDDFHWVDINGQLGGYVVRDGAPRLLTVLSWRDGKVAEAISIVNPDKLRHVHAAWLRSTGTRTDGPGI